MDKQAEMTMELRRARNWILAVAIIMFAMDAIMLLVVYGDRLPHDAKVQLMTYSGLIFVYFLGMYVLARFKPVVACVLALCGFWALHLYLATLDPMSLKNGILLKVLFTLALIRGIKSANRAEQLKKELAEVFG